MSKNNNYAWWILAGCCALTFGMGATLNCGGQYFVSVTRELGVGIGQMSIYFTIQGLCMAFAAPFVGKLLPRVNTRLLLTICYSLALVAVAAMGTYTKIWHWYISGIVFGLAGAFCFLIPAPIILSNWFAKKTGMVIGIAMAFSGVGGAIMNPIIAHLIGEIGWRGTYMVNAAVAAMVVLPFTLFVLNFKPADRGLLPYGYDANAAAQAGSGQQTAEMPGVPAKEALSSLAFWCLFLVFGLIAYTSRYAQQFAPYADSINLPSIAGIMVSLCMVGNIIGKIGLGIINDRWGAKTMTVLGMGIVLAAFALLLASGRSVPLILTAAFMSGFAMSMAAVASPLLARSIFGPRDYSTIFANLSVGQSLIAAFSMTIIGFIYDGTGSYIPTFIVGSCAAVLAVVLVFVAFGASKKLSWNSDMTKA